MPRVYEVFVGYGGRIVQTESYGLAKRVFDEHVALSKRDTERYHVVLTQDGQPLREHRSTAEES